VALAVAAYAWWRSGLRRFTAPALVAVLLPGLVVAAVASRRRRRRSLRPPAAGPTRRSVAPGGTVAWAAVAVAAAVWELLAFRLHPRSSHPTLSSMATAALAHRPVDAAAFAAWLVLGWDLARR
jgi:hypothetical protein